MSKIVYKVFAAWQHEKEENWLNEMSSNGYHLIKVRAIRYSFDENKQERYTYRIELLENSFSSVKSQEYIEFLKDTGISVVGNNIGWIYLRKEYDEIGFDIYSDIDSKIVHFKRVLKLISVVLAINLLNLINMMISYSTYLFKFNEVGKALPIYLIVFVSIALLFGAVNVFNKVKKLERDRNLIE